MDDTLRMCKSECLCDVAKNRYHFGDRQADFGQQTMPHRFACNKWHDEVRQLVSYSGSENGNYMRMLQLCREHDLALESLGVEASGEFGRQYLYYYCAA